MHPSNFYNVYLVDVWDHGKHFYKVLVGFENGEQNHRF